MMFHVYHDINTYYFIVISDNIDIIIDEYIMILTSDNDTPDKSGLINLSCAKKTRSTSSKDLDSCHYPLCAR